jgi:hypothetical protein
MGEQTDNLRRALKEWVQHNKGYRLVYAPEVLAHFFSKFKPIE